ncbi:TonB-dependent receptor [Qipengyuania sp. DSG2-2]|uniref:TonB-dependent receptor n=1 Tax=Qipengyuania sp. DGS2-2 TaxID=3349631 RepID=UPI0036D3C008
MIASIGHARTLRRMRPLLLASAAGLFTVPGVALAQDDVGSENQTEAGPGVIIVTARKQEETLQEVPVTVTVLGGDTLEKYNVDQVADVVSRVPTLNVQVGGSGSGGQLSLRGVGSSNISAAFDSAVAFDYDGVQISTMRMVQAGFFDTQQIDILKGPQSLFFGKSASAGVFSIKSANPTPTWEIGGKASYEIEEKGYTVSGFVSGPVSDTLGIRLAAQYNKIDEYVELQPGTPAANGPFRGQKNIVARGTIQWDPAPEFTANLKLQYVRHENDGAIGHSDIFCGANGVADPVFLLSGVAAIPAGNDCDIQDGRYFLPDVAPALAAQVPGNDASVGFNGVPFGETDIKFGRLRMDWDATDSLTLTSVTGLLEMDAIDVDSYSYVGIGPAFSPIGNAIGDPTFLATNAPALAATNGPGVPLGTGASDPINRLDQFSQELRLASDFGGAFDFMVGAYYETRTFVFDTAQQGVNISLIAPDPVTGNTFDWDKIHTTDTEAKSIFGSVSFDLTEQLEISGGVRYTDEEKVQTISIPYVHTFLSSGPAFVNSGFFSGPIAFSDSNWSPEATIRYQATPDINVFASFKTGFKSGGIDNSALPSFSLLGFDSPDPAVRQATADGLIFQSEEAIGGEIGVKSQFDNRNITLNVTGYHYVFDNLQVQNFNATTIQFITLNAGEVTTQGIDVAWAYRTPLDGLSFSGNLSYLDATFSDDFFTPGADGQFNTGDDINLNGRDVARAPKWAGNIAADWFIPMGNSLELGLNGNVSYSDSYFTDEDTLNDFVQDSFITIDASVSVGHPDGNWRLALVGVNLTDEIYVNTSGGRPFLSPGGAAGFGLPAGDDLVVTQNRGRQVFVEASFRF